jgi:hypothetical protein
MLIHMDGAPNAQSLADRSLRNSEQSCRIYLAALSNKFIQRGAFHVPLQRKDAPSITCGLYLIKPAGIRQVITSGNKV